MRIKRLEVHGFKSFADRAVVSFGDGITGVVGPNGCGKSNVVDAIRWCMGEMSAKHLRGRAMQDVIFAGSDSRGPMGMAEVTLTFHNDGNVPPQYTAFSEISVTRRLHKDGESEYLVNKVPARLRDITDLFLGTGVGTRAYSIIEQGRIGFIVSAKPEERRTLIEEVAGITKFKARKKAAERRMESTQQNLLRVNDIVAELERQLGTLRRQAKKAERYKELKGELRELELHQATVDYLQHEAVLTMQTEERGKLEAALTDAQVAVAVRESTLDGDRLRLLEEERRLQLEQQASAEVDARLATLERDVADWRRQLEDSGSRAAEAARESREASERIGAVRAEHARLVADTQVLEQQVQADRARVEEFEQLVRALQHQRDAIDGELEYARREAVEHIHGAAQHRSLLASLTKLRADVRQRIEAGAAELDDVQVRREEASGKARQLELRRSEGAVQLDAWLTKLAEHRAELTRATSELVEIDRKVMHARDELTKRRSRLHSLEEIAKRFEGYSDGVRTLMADGKPVLAGLSGLVADIAEVPSDLEVAIEAALGQRVQYLLVADQEVGAAAMHYLSERQGGRGGFLPMRPRLDSREFVAPAGEGVVGVALAQVRVKAGFEEAAEWLLGRVVIVRDLETARRLWTESPSATFVTLAGEVLESSGAMLGGSAEGAGLLAKRREIRELTVLVGTLEGELEAARAIQQQLTARRLQIDVDIQQLEKDTQAAKLEQVELAKDAEASAVEVRRLSERAEVVAYELEQRRAELTELDEDERRAHTLATTAEQGKAEVEGRIEQANARRSAVAAELEQRSRGLTELKVHLAAEGQRLLAARTSIERLAAAELELVGRIERATRAIQECDALAADLHGKVEDGVVQCRELAAEAASRRTALSEARGKYETERAGQNAVESELRELRRRVEVTQSALLDAKMDIQRLGLERQKLVEQIRDRHDVELVAVLGEYHLRPLPGPEEVERRGELDRSIKAMGPINLTAIDECTEIEQRYGFLVKQRDDLNQALEALKRAIQRINRASRERFQEAFDAVNEMFQQVYPRLFRGGEARLELVTSEDLLEAGVEIVAQPPGKKLQSVGLLSGGEKALTATALVFAIFLIKPSPFCILDEVDAPLDEANVGRFNEMLREISKISQFIVITHNKNTMQQADKLYGITMEEPGMSKVVSVDLQRRDATAAA